MMEVLRTKIEKHKAMVLRDLDLNKQLLSQLSKAGIVDITDCVQLQQMKDRTERNRVFLDILLSRKNDAVYVKFIDTLQATGQTGVADKLIDVGEEMQVLSHMQTHLNTQLTQMSKFLTTEERRVGIYLTEPQLEDDDGNPATSEPDIWAKVQESIQRSQQLLTRCQNVISKLHRDCETVAKQNSDIIEHTKECDARIKEVLTVGRQSAKQRSVPKKTHDLFANLMDDIEKLVKSRRKVITMETEGRRHSTRIVRQCRDWLGSRSLALQKLNSMTGAAARSNDPMRNGEVTSSPHREAPPTNDNAIMSILDSLQLLEKELQEYVHQEVTLSDKYRAEMRRKHLQKQVHGFNVNGFTDMENALKAVQKDPEKLADNVAVLQSCVAEINKEYGQCVFYINKVIPDDDSSESNSEVSNSSPRMPKKDARNNPRNWPANVRTKPALGGKTNRSIDNNLNIMGKERSEPNQLLQKIQVLVAKYDEMKNEDQMLSSKHRSEISRKKREMDILLQKKEDQIIRLQTEVKEAEAEKEKYKKLYNDTKIGYQRNHDNLITPR